MKKKTIDQAHLIHKNFIAKNKNCADEFRGKWQNEILKVDLEQKAKPWDVFLHPTTDITILPNYSFIIQFEFKLKKAYISRDDQDFYIIDNPVRKDKVFDLPYVAPSSWKGSLRSALWHLNFKETNEQIKRIFGNEKQAEAETALLAGRLRIYPSFFTKKSLEIINPHARKNKVGKNPILIETVPKDATANFTLLYVPFGAKEVIIKEQMVVDLKLLAEGLQAMFTLYGFGAKTTSGHGLAEISSNGKINIKTTDIQVDGFEEKKEIPPDEKFIKYFNDDGSIKEEFKNNTGGLLSNNESKSKFSDMGFREYKSFQREHKNNQKQWQKYFEQQQNNSTIHHFQKTFNNFEVFSKLVTKIADNLQ